MSIEVGFGEKCTGPLRALLGVMAFAATMLCVSSGWSQPTSCSSAAECEVPNAITSCETFGCVLQTCNAPFANCDGQYSNGCEANLESPENCGDCGNDCTGAFPNAEAQCTGSMCTPGPCLSGFYDCDGDEFNGCESSQPCGGFCGDGICDQGEESVCPEDCETGFCGDGICDGNETQQTCSEDCGQSQPFCGNGIKETGEECDAGTSNGMTACGCDEGCQFPSSLSTCDDGSFCTATDTCDGAGSCVGSGDPCDAANPYCDEELQACLECVTGSDCDDGLTCNGAETCSASGVCETGTAVSCDANETCEEPEGNCACADGFVADNDTGDCVPAECGNAGDCENDLGLAPVCQQYECINQQCETTDRSSDIRCGNADFCDGTESCEAGACVASGNPCDTQTEVCDEFNDRCSECITNVDCDGDQLCDGSGNCVECLTVSDCAAPTNECRQVACSAGLCEYSDRTPGAACTSDGNACNGQEICTFDGAPLCEAENENPCTGEPENPVCNQTGSDLFECVGECGDGLVGVGEECDLGEGTNSDDNQVSGCSNTCTLNEGYRCPGGADSCAEPETVCGDGVVIFSEELCDEGSLNGTTDCGCTANCDFALSGTSCEDGEFCTAGDTCNGEGGCMGGASSPCALGSDACREGSDSCDECLDGIDCDNGDACDGAETCDTDLGICVDGNPVSCSGDLSCDVQSGDCVCPVGESEVEPGVCEPIECEVDADCDDNNVCNGEETCNQGTGQCIAGQALTCDNGIACDGAETCSASDGCLTGTPVSCGPGFECTEPEGTCTSLCGNGELDGDEECDDGAGNSDTEPDACRTNCQPASCGDEVIDTSEECDDGNGIPGDGCSANCLEEECTVETVAEDCGAVGVCQRADCIDGACFYNDLGQGETTADCDSDGTFCNGTEACDGDGSCTSSGDPCQNPSFPLCDEALDACVECLAASDCDDGVFCNGEETCGAEGSCTAGSPVDCGPGSRCDVVEDECVSLCGNGICDEGETVESCLQDCSTIGPDSDGDGVGDADEEALGTKPNDPDSDGDGVRDDIEVGSVSNPRDTDDDGIIDALDPDDDGDGIATADEDINEDGDPTNDDSDRDGTPNFRDDDDDGDTVPTIIEATRFTETAVLKQTGGVGLLDTDEDGTPNYLDEDDDNDTILTANEVPALSQPWKNNTDGDEFPNYVDDDDDGDTLLTADELSVGGGDFDKDNVSNHLDEDDDGDSVLTATEVQTYSSNPFKTDTDDDLLLDGDEVEAGTTLTDSDTDDDGLIDGTEVELGADPLDEDTDDDGLLDGEEVNEYGTGVKNPDSDNDFLLDGEEVNRWNTDPLDEDSDGDGLLDGDEIAFGSDPNNSDSDGDGVPDGEEGYGVTSSGANCSTSPSAQLPLLGLLVVGLLFERRRRRR